MPNLISSPLSKLPLSQSKSFTWVESAVTLEPSVYACLPREPETAKYYSPNTDYWFWLYWTFCLTSALCESAWTHTSYCSYNAYTTYCTQHASRNKADAGNIGDSTTASRIQSTILGSADFMHFVQVLNLTPAQKYWQFWLGVSCLVLYSLLVLSVGLAFQFQFLHN